MKSPHASDTPGLLVDSSSATPASLWHCILLRIKVFWILMKSSVPYLEVDVVVGIFIRVGSFIISIIWCCQFITPF
jgi:hypothetical protein